MGLQIFPRDGLVADLAEADVPHAMGRVHAVVDARYVTLAGKTKKECHC